MPMKDLTPSERAQLHQKQLAEREARKKAAFSPGPGQYDMDKVDRNGKNATLADMRGETNPDWAFKSKSAQRREHKAAQTGLVGPGAYSPTVIKTGGNDSLASGKGEGNMAAATMKSVAKRGSPYGPPDDLVQLASKHGAKLPSPANYSPQQDFKGRNWEVQQTKGENISQPNAAFVSKSKQRQALLAPLHTSPCPRPRPHTSLSRRHLLTPSGPFSPVSALPGAPHAPERRKTGTCHGPSSPSKTPHRQLYF